MINYVLFNDIYNGILWFACSGTFIRIQRAAFGFNRPINSALNEIIEMNWKRLLSMKSIIIILTKSTISGFVSMILLYFIPKYYGFLIGFISGLYHFVEIEISHKVSFRGINDKWMIIRKNTIYDFKKLMINYIIITLTVSAVNLFNLFDLSLLLTWKWLLFGFILTLSYSNLILINYLIIRLCFFLEYFLPFNLVNAFTYATKARIL